MKFSKYNSIDNSYNKKVLEKIFRAPMVDQPFVALEKIHGTNFSITINRSTRQIKFGKRTGFIDENDTFYNYEKISPDLIRFAKTLLLEIKHGDELVIYGELCGGNFFGDTADGSKKVQSGVNYHKDTKFLAFDLMIDGEYLYWAKAERSLKAAGFDVVPTIKVCKNLDEALEVNETFNSMVPLMYGLITPETENLAEGIVIKPMNQEMVVGRGSRLILKKKTTSHSENKGKKKTVKKTVKLDKESKALLEDLSTYITPQRVDAVVSKIGDNITSKDFTKICGLLTQDAIKDYETDVDGNLKKLLGDEWKAFNNELIRIGSGVLRDKWLEYVEG